MARVARSLLSPPEVHDSPVERLKRLQTDVAVSWEGNLQQRAGHMDANAFAAEVRRAEHVRLKLNERLVEVLDGFADQSFTPNLTDRSDLFVLPVDDFDLNPPRCLELLELLRTLSVPRLFFVVLGDVAVAEVMCGLQIAGDMAKVAGRTWGDAFLPAHPHEIQSLIANVSGNILRKLLPPGQRVHLGPAKIEEALKFRPVGSQSDTPTLAQRLAGIALPLGLWSGEVQQRFRTREKLGTPIALNLLQFLRAENWSATLGVTGGEFYHARQFLELPLRHLADLWFALNKAGEADPTGTRTPFDRFRAELHFFCRDMFQAEESLPPEARRKFLAEFDVDPDSEWTLSADPFRLVPAVHRYAIEVGDATHYRGGNLPPQTIRKAVCCQASTGWEFREKELQPGSRPLFLTPSTTALIIFYTDLVTLARGDGERNPLLDLAGVAWRFANVRYEFVRPVRSPDAAASVHNVEVGGNIVIALPPRNSFAPDSAGFHTFPELAWPFPPVATFWEADRFLNGWLQVIRGVEKVRKESESTAGPIPHLVYQWINLGHAVLSGDSPIVREEYPSAPTQQDGQQLAVRMEQLRAKYAHAANGDRVIRWIVEVISLLNEEFLGLNSPVVTGFLQQPILVSLCRQRGRRFAETKEEYLRDQDAGRRAVGLLRAIPAARALSRVVGGTTGATAVLSTSATRDVRAARVRDAAPGRRSARPRVRRDAGVSARVRSGVPRRRCGTAPVRGRRRDRPAVAHLRDGRGAVAPRVHSRRIVLPPRPRLVRQPRRRARSAGRLSGAPRERPPPARVAGSRSRGPGTPARPTARTSPRTTRGRRRSPRRGGGGGGSASPCPRTCSSSR